MVIELVLGLLLVEEPSGWLQLGPIGVAVPSPADGEPEALRRAVSGGLRWGFSAGAVFEPVPNLWISASAGFEQNVWMFRNLAPGGYELCFRGDCYGWDERALGQLIRIGPELRLGYGGRRLLAWVQLTGHLGIARIRLDCNNAVEDHCDRSEMDLGPGVGAGLGLGVRLTPKFGLGVEAGFDHSWLDRRPDPFRVAQTLDLGLVALIRF